MIKAWFKITLWKRILGALVLGLIAGLIWGEGANSIRWMGDIFVRSIRMLVVPLIFTTLVAGVVSMGDARRLGSIGLKAFALYLGTTALAITIGLIFGTVMQPGVGVDLSGAEAETLSSATTLGERLINMIPINPIAALAEGNILAVIIFAILIGIGIIMVGDEAKVLRDVFNAGADVMLKLTFIVMELAPFGVFALIAWVAGTQGAETLLKVVTLAVAVYAACVAHIIIVQLGMVKFLARLPILPFARGAVDPQLLAYSTSSSAATLPATMAAAEENMGIGVPVRSSVLPLGATVNMDGTALYVGIVALFSAQAFGVELAMSDYLIIGLTTTLVSIGTASVPSASLFLLAAVLTSIGISAEQTAIIVGFILPFDRVLDMMRTVVNVTGDLAVATVVAKSENELDEETYNAAPDL
ncbi:MAG: dicarboxylate/amino acid:cation symporter [Pseudomonadota bacterium]|jgi:Na+/H+-dicarboxylate symporter|nr:dicarboxylate/amino acid:cation symporter [Pseudomonadota bacterium]